MKAKGFNTQYTEKYKKEVENLLNQLDTLGGNGKISRATAIHFIEKSAWWLTHPSGPVREPGYANRIEGPETALSLKYGANTFKITQALLKCIKIIRNTLKKNLANPQLSEKALGNLKNSLVEAISSSVTRFDGSPYEQYRVKGDEMVFGAHAINVKEFIDCFFGMIPVDRFIWKHLEAKQKDQNTKNAIKLLKIILKKTDRKDFPTASLIAAEFRRRDPKFSIKSTHFKKFTDLLLYCSEGQQFHQARSASEKSTQNKIQATPKFSKDIKKYFEAMLLAKNRTTQVENAILTLQSVDSLLKEGKGITSKSVFSALTETFYKKRGDTKHLGSLITKLFSQQQSAVRNKQGDKTIPEINSRLKWVLKTIEIEIPHHSDLESKNEG